MSVSIIICTHTMDRYDVFTEAVESALQQTFDPIEVVLIIDGNPDVYNRAVADFGGLENVVISDNKENRGISYSRTRGAEVASGDIVAFIDDDGVAEPDWIENLMYIYRASDAIAVGGDVQPNWTVQRPEFFPEEFYWLVGCVEPGFAEDGEEVRNTYGSNISYRREAFLKVGGYDPKTGRKGDRHLQAHEAPVGIRLIEEFGKGMVYTDSAVVHHTLFDYRADYRWLLERSFWQGYSKRVLELLYPNGPDDKSDYLGWLVRDRVPGRLTSLLRSPSRAKFKQLCSIATFTAAVGLGYFYGIVRRGVVEKANSADDAAGWTSRRESAQRSDTARTVEGNK